jgi:hypothetical protein
MIELFWEETGGLQELDVDGCVIGCLFLGYILGGVEFVGMEGWGIWHGVVIIFDFYILYFINLIIIIIRNYLMMILV